jgi:hypothetical protein
MSALPISPVYPIFTDIDGQPLEAGYVWIGTANLDPQTNPITVYWDAAQTILAAQPIRTIGGYLANNGTPAQIYVDSDFSCKVMNKNGSTLYSAATSSQFQAFEFLTGAVNAASYVSLAAAVAAIGAQHKTLVVNNAQYLADGSTLTIPANISLKIEEGGSIERVVGGSLVTTLVLNCKTETRYGFFTGLTVTVNGPFLFFGNYDDLDTTKVTFAGALNPTNDGLTVGNLNIVSGSAAPTKMIPNNPAFPVSEICMFADLDAADRLVTIAGHGSMPPPVIPGQELFHIRKYAIYTSNSSGGQNKRIDLDANATDATMWQSNTKAFLITASTNPLTTFMVGVNSPAFDTTNHIFDPSTCSAYYGGSSGIFRKDGVNRDVLVVENRNGVNGDQANILYALQDTVTGNELTMAQIKVVGTEQFGPNYQTHLEFITRFQNTFKTNISMFRDSVAINNRATNSAALEISAKDDGVSFLMYGYNKSQTVLSFTATSQTGALGNAAENVFRVGTSATTGRSINAGGTINASGADYAEYMEKAGNFTLAKGDVCGIDANGKLTNIFADAVSFVVKSTDPSYVGNDGWARGLNEPMAPIYKSPEYQGSENPGPRPVMQEIPPNRISDDQYVAMVEEKFQEELNTWISINDQFKADKAAFVALCEAEQKAFDEGPMAQYLSDKQVFDAQLEEQRQKMDRIAFAGQVPVNVTGAAPGQYIVPSEDNGSIKGIAISNPTFEQYQTSVGKVIAVQTDGRARIIVKVA